MIMAESVFMRGQPVGRIFSDSNSGTFTFQPARGKSPLLQSQWRDVDALRKAIYEAYETVPPEKAKPA